MREIQSNSQARWYMFVSVSGIVVFIVGCFLGSWKVIGFGLLMIGGWYKGLQGIYAMISFYFMYKKQKAKLKEIKPLFSESEIEEFYKKQPNLKTTKSEIKEWLERSQSNQKARIKPKDDNNHNGRNETMKNLPLNNNK
jgi:hypothetical protein